MKLSCCPLMQNLTFHHTDKVKGLSLHHRLVHFSVKSVQLCWRYQPALNDVHGKKMTQRKVVFTIFIRTFECRICGFPELNILAVNKNIFCLFVFVYRMSIRTTCHLTTSFKFKYFFSFKIHLIWCAVFLHSVQFVCFNKMQLCCSFGISSKCI